MTKLTLDEKIEIVISDQMYVLKILSFLLDDKTIIEDRLDKLEKKYEKMVIKKNIQKRSRTMENETTSKRRTNKQP